MLQRNLIIVLMVCATSGCGNQSSTTIADGTGARYQLVRAGSFLMGSDERIPQHPFFSNGKNPASPAHEVRISRDFYLGLTEVTQGQWETVMSTTPWLDEQGTPRESVKVGPNYPAVFVSWEDASSYCKHLSSKDGVEYRLPTEAEWEYACRAGTRTSFCFGDYGFGEQLERYAWFAYNSGYAQRGHAGHAPSDNARHAHQVAQKLANAWGFYDMHGNVSEWCADWYSPDYYGQSPALDPQGPELTDLWPPIGGLLPWGNPITGQIVFQGTVAIAQGLPTGTLRDGPRGPFRVFRGGFWFSGPQGCTSASRNGARSRDAGPHIGFRVVRVAVNSAGQP